MKIFFTALYFLIFISPAFPRQPQEDSSAFPMQRSGSNRYFPALSDQNQSVMTAHAARPAKSPALGMTLSAIIPGSGQIYAGSWLKGLILIGAETALWISYAHNHKNGQKWEDRFQEYADTHWSREKWDFYYNPETDPSTHHLPLDNNGNVIKTQQYYEMIGKYDQFVQGWPDWDPDNRAVILTPMRDYYEGMRHKSNQAFIAATNLTMLVMVNHLISIFDTALTMRGINRAHARMRMTMLPTVHTAVPAMALQINF